jgi:hypothetical protein
MLDLDNLLAKLPEIRERVTQQAIYYEWTDEDSDGGDARPDVHALLSIIDALQKANDEISAELTQANIDYMQVTNGGRDLSGYEPTAANAPTLEGKRWHLPELGALMAVDTQDQRDNSYGPFDTREEAQADWRKVISDPPPGEDGDS